MKQYIISLLVLFGFPSILLGQSTISPTWIEYDSADGTKRGYSTPSIALTNTGKLIWPVDDLGGTTIYSIDITTPSQHRRLCRLDGYPQLNVGPRVRTLYSKNGKLVAGGHDTGYNRGFTCLINETNGDTLWYLPEIDLIRIDAVTCDDSLVYSILGEKYLYLRGRYYDNTLSWDTKYGADSLILQASSMVEYDSVIYVAGSIENLHLTPSRSVEPYISIFDKKNGVFVNDKHLTPSSAAYYRSNILDIAQSGDYIYVCGYVADDGASDDVFIAKLRMNLDAVWIKKWGTNSSLHDLGISLAIDSSENIWVAVTSYHEWNRYKENSLLKFSDNGKLVFEGKYNIPLPQTLFVNSILFNEGSLYGAGSSNYESKQFQVVMLFAIDTSMPLATKNDRHTSTINIYPNPFSTSARVMTNDSNSNYNSFSIYDLLGRVIRTQTITEPSSIVISREDLTPGLYYLILYSNNRQAKRLPFIVE